jgi:hypothetical protein
LRNKKDKNNFELLKKNLRKKNKKQRQPNLNTKKNYKKQRKPSLNTKKNFKKLLKQKLQYKLLLLLKLMKKKSNGCKK